MALTDSDAAFVRTQRVAHLATVTAEGDPHVVPVCFAFDGERFYTAADQKPKGVPPQRLRRFRNLVRHPRVSLILDHYDEDWNRLRYLLVHGQAALVEEPGERNEAVRLLREKYDQYRDVDFETSGGPIVRIRPVRVHRWLASEEAENPGGP